jgi:transcriptional regulator with XRE-family HTH domain
MSDVLSSRRMPSSSRHLSSASTKGELIRTLRNRCGMTQEHLAAKAGISEWQLSRIECGKAEPSRDTLERVAPWLGVTVAYFDAQALGEAVAQRATDPTARTVVERVLALHDRIATMSETELGTLFELLEDIERGNIR